MYTALKLLHVLSAIWLLSGLLARPTVLAAARRAPDVRILKAIADVSGRLEDRMMAFALATGPFTVGRDRRWGEALEESARAGAITERLRPFLERDAMIRRYAPDIVAVLVIVVLMVAKPF